MEWRPNNGTNGECEGGLPDGSRTVTPRELAACQRFDADFEFFGNNVKRQVGNAVPPPFAKALYTSVRKSLEAFDALTVERKKV